MTPSNPVSVCLDWSLGPEPHTVLFTLSLRPLTQRKHGFFLDHLLKVLRADHRFHGNKIQFCQITSRVFFSPHNLMVTYSHH